MRSINKMILLAWALACLACHSTPVVALEAEQRIDSVSSQQTNVPGRWRLNAAGQLEFLYDPLGNGRDLVRKTHTVVLVDRAPKMCGTPDPRRRHPGHRRLHRHLAITLNELFDSPPFLPMRNFD